MARGGSDWRQFRQMAGPLDEVGKVSRSYKATKATEDDGRELRALRKSDRARRDGRREIVRLSYSGEPQRILFGPDAGKLARVGLDARGGLVIVPLDRIIGKVGER